MTDVDLRTSLGLRPRPDFDLALPAGWVRHQVDEASLQAMVAGLRRRSAQAGNPEGFAAIRGLLERSFRDMSKQGAFAYFAATDDDPATLWVPASLVASVRRAEPHESLDSLVKDLIREEGATALRGDRRFVRVEKSRIVRLGTESVVNHSIMYLTPFPGSGRRRALQLVAGFGHPLDVPAEDPSVRALIGLFDTCVSTLRWRPATDDLATGVQS
ncbi:protein TPRXL [uncultured Nocardioides sp.]|jgi:hypothetical protein|uniref:protein TPRXL n=1 Tax=uncultured Nocardioides sp. TaxID=198441 RepID=UPI000C6687D3|nr:protein TPRXL [uncultured Nocardioides sp.]MAO82208.1 protein TPRXL [Nocardioides sp.]